MSVVLFSTMFSVLCSAIVSFVTIAIINQTSAGRRLYKSRITDSQFKTNCVAQDWSNGGGRQILLLAVGCYDHEIQPCRLGSMSVLVCGRYSYSVAHSFTRRATELGLVVWTGSSASRIQILVAFLFNAGPPRSCVRSCVV